MTTNDLLQSGAPLTREAPAKSSPSFEELVAVRQLTPDELVKLAKQMVDSTDPAETERLKQLIVTGFYGPPEDA